MYVFLNRRRKKGEERNEAQQMTGTIWFWWKITHLVTTQHARPLPQCLTLSHVTVIQERLQLEKVKRWPGPRTKWSQLSKSTCSKEEMVFAAKQSITCNYNDSTLEDGFVHFIMRSTLSCLMTAAEVVGRGLGEAATGTMWNRYSVPCPNAFIFSFYVPHELSPWVIIFLHMPAVTFITDVENHRRQSILNF